MTTPEEQRDKMLGALMDANIALQKIPTPSPEREIGADSFLRLLPYHAQIIQDMAETIYTLPEGERVVPSRLRELLYAKRAETDDINYFEALELFIAVAFAH